MRTRTLGSFARTLTFALSASLLASVFAAPAEARSVNASKIDTLLAQQAAADPDGQFDVIVRAAAEQARPGARPPAQDRAREVVRRHGGRTRFALGIVGGAAATLSGREILTLTHDPDVGYVFRDAKIAASFDPVADYAKVTSVGILITGANLAWYYLNVCGRGVGVAVVDSGVAPHPDLAGRIVVAADFTQDPPLISTSPLGDPGGHGTHVAGLVAGDGASSAGTYTGTAPCARIIDVRVLDSMGQSSTSIVLRGLQWVLANRKTYGIRVVNMSFGAQVSTSYRLDPLSVAAETLVLAGLSVVVAAGNAGPGSQTIAAPANDPFVLTVGALDDAGSVKPSDDSVATFSARGPSKFDALSKPDLVAPGRKLVSLLAPDSTIAGQFPDRLVTAAGAPAPQYLRLSGTSMAAPIVSGLIALLLEKEPTLSPFQVKHRLKLGVRKLNKVPLADAGNGLATAYPLWLTDLVADYPAVRVADAFAQDMYTVLYGQTLPWRSITYNGGVDSAGTQWSAVTWENIAWDNIAWENIAWESFRWDAISWENIAWEHFGSDGAGQYDLIVDGSVGWTLMD
jgi:serine protease AprX